MKKIFILLATVLLPFLTYVIAEPKAWADMAPDRCGVYKNCLVYTYVTTNIDIGDFQNQVYLIKTNCLDIQCSDQPNPDTNQYSNFIGNLSGGPVIALDKEYVDTMGGLDALFNHINIMVYSNKSETFEYPKNDAEFKKHKHDLYVSAQIPGLDYGAPLWNSGGKQGDIVPFNPFGTIEHNSNNTQGYQIVGSGGNQVVVIYKPLGFLCDTNPCKLILYAAEQSGDDLEPGSFSPPKVNGLVTVLYPKNANTATTTLAGNSVQTSQQSIPIKKSFWSTFTGFFSSLWSGIKGLFKK